MSICEYDTGSMFDCRPACSEPASLEFVYSNGSFGPFSMVLCEGHLRAMRGRVFPSVPVVSPLVSV